MCLQRQKIRCTDKTSFTDSVTNIGWQKYDQLLKPSSQNFDLAMYNPTKTHHIGKQGIFHLLNCQIKQCTDTCM